MKVRAYLDQGLWASELEKLARLTSKSIEETMRAQARLLVADCILLTPPCEHGKVPTGRMAGRFKEQLEIGRRAIIRDVNKVFVPQQSRKVFSLSGRPAYDRIANDLAKLAERRDVNAVNDVLARLKYGSKNSRFAEIQRGAHIDEMKARRNSRGRIDARNNRVLIHSGVAKPYEPAYQGRNGWKFDSSISSLVEQITDKMGRAKGGWAVAAKELKLALPKWIRKHRNKAEGFIKPEGKGTPKFSITIASTVPYMQASGAQLNIIQRAWQRRIRNLQKQRQITEYGRKRSNALTAWKLTKDQDKAI